MTLIRIGRWFYSRPRRTKRILLLTADVFGLMLVIWFAFCFRFERIFVPNFEQTLFILAGPAIAVPIFIYMGLYRAVLRYLRERAIWTIIQAVTFSTLAWVSLVFLTLSYGAEGIPRTIAVLYWIGSIIGVTGSRFGIKWLLSRGLPQPKNRKRVLIYGEGDAAVQLAEALHSAGECDVIGFVTDDVSLHGMDILGIRVYPTSRLEELITNMGAEEVIIATSSTSTRKRRELVASVGPLHVKIRVLPPIADLAAGKYLVSYVRDIDIDDLLGRSPVPADPALMRSVVEGRVILITGAAGSIGSALCRTVAQIKPAKLILLEINELGLYEIERELRGYGSFPVVPVLGSITNRNLVNHVLNQYGVQTVYHCAAYKHVSLVEGNKLEGVRNNVFGTLTVVEEAAAADVENFILISSDKAVRPTSVMGATKRWAELIVRHHGAEAKRLNEKRVFGCVRFGNVIGSSGSVVPLFKEQIAGGGPVTLTDEGMTRYFMSIREAAELIVQAGALSQCGDILLLDMGEPVKIRDLAEDMIMLAGLTVRNIENPDGDVEIVTIGIREGEKLQEELFYDPKGVMATHHPKILRAQSQNGCSEQMPAMLAQLEAAIDSGDEELLYQALFGLLGEDGNLSTLRPVPQPASVDKTSYRRSA